jgi:hypothetical protein
VDVDTLEEDREMHELVIRGLQSLIAVVLTEGFSIMEIVVAVLLPRNCCRL